MSQSNRPKRNVLLELSLCIAGLTLVMMATGCKNLVQRSQSPDNFTLPLLDDKKDTDGYIGSICRIDGLSYAKIEGIGLAVNLNNTGSNPKPGGQREFLVRELQSKSEGLEVEKLLSGLDTEMVFMKGMMPPGIRKGEKFDIEIRTNSNTECQSLENGFVYQTRMRPMEKLGRGVEKGHVLGLAKGRIMVDSLFETRKDRPNLLHGYILGGGVALEDRTLALMVGREQHDMKTTTMISRAINSRFTFVDSGGRQGCAEPKTDRYVELVVPDEYRHNIGRYLQVVVNLAHSESPATRLERMQKLEQEMMEPAKSNLTALRLEALGNDGVPILKRALLHDDLEVKFHAAQALAYMGEPDGIGHLRFVAEHEPAFRWHALTALSSLKDREAGAALTELMHVKSAETRYGAFQAMLARSPEDPLMDGKWLGDFYLHRIPSDTVDPMLHFSRSKRPEIVMFGNDQTVTNNFLYVESRLTIRATGNGTVTVTRYSAENGEERKVCSNRVADLIETLAQTGFSYSEILKMFRSSKDSGTLSSRLVVNAMPKLGRSYVPGELEEESPAERSQHYLSDSLPGLFDNDGLGQKLRNSARKSTYASAKNADGEGPDPKNATPMNTEPKSAEKPDFDSNLSLDTNPPSEKGAESGTSIFGNMLGWFAGGKGE